jgi:hypothetical protein
LRVPAVGGGRAAKAARTSARARRALRALSVSALFTPPHALTPSSKHSPASLAMLTRRQFGEVLSQKRADPKFFPEIDDKMEILREGFWPQYPAAQPNSPSTATRAPPSPTGQTRQSGATQTVPSSENHGSPLGALGPGPGTRPNAPPSGEAFAACAGTQRHRQNAPPPQI